MDSQAISNATEAPATTTDIQPVVVAGESVMPETATGGINEKRGRGRPRKDATATKAAPAAGAGPGSVVIPGAADEQREPMTEDTARVAARSYVFAFLVGGSTVLGPKFMPEGTEADGLVDAVTQYFVENGIQKPPAWLGIVLAAGSYVGAKVVREEEIKKNLFGLLAKTGIYKPKTAALSNPERTEQKPIGG